MKQWNLLPLIWESAKCSYPCLLKCYKQNDFVQIVWRASSVLFIFTFRPIALRQLNSLTIFDIFIELCGPEVRLGCKRSPVRIPVLARFLCFIFCFSVVVVLLFAANSLYVTKLLHFFCHINPFSKLNIAMFVTDYKVIKIQTKHL